MTINSNIKSTPCDNANCKCQNCNCGANCRCGK